MQIQFLPSARERTRLGSDETYMQSPAQLLSMTVMRPASQVHALSSEPTDVVQMSIVKTPAVVHGGDELLAAGEREPAIEAAEEVSLGDI
jgi:hypothetical protein